ncbi:hypothetical protein GA0116948_101291 [Chitinophaga costaii]|uniref:DKNYY family protein n=1 Tax=Chitinophaga costaii TaxID=1335309 RepID=A0A1C3Z957_9BACT|nr:hypothetical protein [Chitinophaga costaii]PUZ30280.1 hypothetical protein DCM91_02050 [Chitinophaga costaii]SCB78856.1 hypothetical protein GA0116948_101291 [Chitinophaga costaii]
MVKSLFLCIVVACNLSALAQSSPPPPDNAILNGVEYTDYYEHMYDAKHPFYMNNAFTWGEVTYFGRHYDRALLKYDIIKDELITVYADSITPITLYPEQVDSFKIYGQKFVRMTNGSGLPPGYYAHIYGNEKFEVFAHYTKSMLQQQYVNGGLYDLVSDHDYYYLKIAGDHVFHSFKGLKGLGDLLNAPRKQTKLFQRNNPYTDSENNRDATASSSRLRDYCTFLSK